MAECTPCKLLLPFIAFSLPLDSQQQTMHQRIPYPHTKAGGAYPTPHRISKLPCLHLPTHGAHYSVRT
eukprot:380170-Pelagomonas_calceolata.AAC.1